MPERPQQTVLPAIRALIDATGLAAMPMSVSARHCHLTRESMDALFGPGSELTVLREVSQPGQYAANQTVGFRGTKGEFKSVRIIGPLRKATQVEVSFTDARMLGIAPPLRNSGDLDESEGGVLIGPKGEFTLDDGVIIAWRHVHMSPKDAETYRVSDGERVAVYAEGQRPTLFDDCIIRVHPNFALDFQIDTDEGNACGHYDGARAWLLPGGLTGSLPGPKGQVPHGKTLITEQDVHKAHQEKRTLWADENTIITPSAHDADNRAGVIKRRATP
ncbi:MAG: phosphate propanoyltransferase [bacterium]